MDTRLLKDAVKELLSGAQRKPGNGEFLGEDGFVHCAKCGEARQAEIALLGETLPRPRHCACERAEF